MKIAVVILSLAVLVLGLSLLSRHSKSEWIGVDEAVVEKLADKVNRKPAPPLIDIEKGDLPLFAFLLAGAIGGFYAGYSFRELFPPKTSSIKEDNPHV